MSSLSCDVVLVTGGVGFIGSHTVDALVENDTKVIILDNLSSGTAHNLKRWKRIASVRFKKGDVRRYKTVEQVARKADAIIHLAAIVSPAISMVKPELTNEVNVSGTLNVLRAAQKSGVDKIVYASSSSVYGETAYQQIPESAPLSPITPYGASKLAAEQYCLTWFRAHRVNTVALRYFNVYGLGQSANPYSGVIAIYADRLRRGLRPVIFGNGRQTRDFVHVSDVAAANLRALQSGEAVGAAINVGTGVETSIGQLATLMTRLARRGNLKPIHSRQRPGDITRSCASIKKLVSTLQFTPKTNLEQGLDQYLKQYGFSRQP